ncbi:MAG: T9SS C-terminal target domain-containing protein, partial [Flavobacteriia bacterium]|nr:T9SS C-terminal target domain-containing protein [Flavobacteriia bacterium]
RQAQLLAINGQNGALLWDYFPYNVNPGDSGLYNFYNPQWIDDVSGDGIMDLLVANGGDHAAPAWDTLRPPGHLMVVNSVNGNLIAKAVVPDSAETYCSPLVVDLNGSGTKYVLYGTGGETLGGSFWICPLFSLLNNTLAPSTPLVSDPNFGFIAPASVYKNSVGEMFFYVQSFSGALYKIKGGDLSVQWSYDLPNTESSAEPVIGNFTGDNTPDVFLSLAKGTSSGYTDYYQVLLNGASGQVVLKDSIGNLQFASGNAVDLNNDGRDEAVISVNYFENGYWKHRLQSFDFVNNTLQSLVPTKAGVNLGSTPLFTNLDGDATMDLVYLVKKDSLNPIGWKGVYARKVELNSGFPNAGIAWGSYLGTTNTGEYYNTTMNCGPGSLISSVILTQPTCNGAANGSIIPTVNLGTPPYTYVWSNGSTASQLNNLPAGSYTLQVTDSANCFEIYTTVLTDPYVISFGGVIGPTCPGDTNGHAIVNSTGCPCMFSGCQFLWENGITTKPNNTLGEGWATITITHPNGCVVVDSVLVPFAAPVIGSTQITDVSCNGLNDGVIQVSPGSATTFQYQWSNGATGPVISSLSPGTYTLYVSDSRPCYDTLQFVINQPSPITANFQLTNETCFNSMDGSILVIPSGGVGGYTYLLNGLSVNNPIDSLGSGTYTVNIVDSNNCVYQASAGAISSPSSLTIALTATPESGVNALDGTASAAVTGGTPPYSYVWNDVNQQTGNLAVYLTQGWYSVNVIDANGCAVSDSLFIGVLETAGSIDFGIQIFPNPTMDVINFSSPIDAWAIYNVQGDLVAEGLLTVQLSVKEVSDGMYHLHFTQQGRNYIHKIIK